MAPTSYQGPLESDDGVHHTHSQTQEGNFGVSAPGILVEDILREKGNEVHSVAPHDQIKDAIGKLARLRIGALVVINPASEVVGILSERDVVNKLDTVGPDVLGHTVDSIMTPDPVTCTPDFKIGEVMRIMTKRRFRHMPVLDDGKVRGMISIGDVISHRLQEVEYENLKIKQAMVG